MSLPSALKMLAASFVVLVVIAASPLIDADAGWKNTLGDVVWTGLFATVALIVVLASVAVARRRTHRA